MIMWSQNTVADRTNGPAYATVLRLSSVRNVLWLNGAFEQKLLLTA